MDSAIFDKSLVEPCTKEEFYMVFSSSLISSSDTYFISDASSYSSFVSPSSSGQFSSRMGLVSRHVCTPITDNVSRSATASLAVNLWPGRPLSGRHGHRFTPSESKPVACFYVNLLVSADTSSLLCFPLAPWYLPQRRQSFTPRKKYPFRVLPELTHFYGA